VCTAASLKPTRRATIDSRILFMALSGSLNSSTNAFATA